MISPRHHQGKDVLKVAAYFHARFEYIHPFTDGNGRVGRTLMNYYLMTHDHPPIIVYDDDKHLYYECLQKYDETEELNPLYEFFKYEAEKTWEKALAFANGMKQERKGLSDFITKYKKTPTSKLHISRKRGRRWVMNCSGYVIVVSEYFPKALRISSVWDTIEHMFVCSLKGVLPC